MRKKIPCEEGEDSPIASPKLDLLSFGMAIFDKIVAPLSFAKWFSSTKEDFDAFRIKRLGFFF